MKVKRLYPIAALLTVAMTATVAAEDPQPPIPQSMATTRGCRDGGIRHPLYKIDPSWVSAAADNAPRVAEGIIRESHVSTEDNPAFHVSHDWNGDVLLEPSYNGLNSDGNNVVNEERLIEIEWESAFFPADFWPVPGDTAWIFGRWIFDCAHPEIAYRTEIHPPKAVAFTRAEPVIGLAPVMQSSG